MIRMKWRVETIGTFENDEELMDFVVDRFGLRPYDVATIDEALRELEISGLSYVQLEA